ncbi:hypothetical protein AUP40_22195 [Thalassospira xiamenensis]|uniref:Uncharacterized protein n=1 Tax=Thalassospira xiamenensis TaxID=220697 RepID=A0ABR5XZN9_9PROT|nr:hypothetical protein AUP40_22195 [Thalassospira xiamenensis]
MKKQHISKLGDISKKISLFNELLLSVTTYESAYLRIDSARDDDFWWKIRIVRSIDHKTIPRMRPFPGDSNHRAA